MDFHLQYHCHRLSANFGLPGNGTSEQFVIVVQVLAELR